MASTENTDKIVVLIRHAKQGSKPDMLAFGGWQVEAVLLPTAGDRVSAAAEYFKKLGIQFDAYFYSYIIRSQETCAMLRWTMGNGESVCFEPMSLNVKLAPTSIMEWEWAFATYLRGLDDPSKVSMSPQFFVQQWPELMKKDAGRTWEAVQEIASGLKPGQTAAAVSHNPLVRLTQWAATGILSDGPDVVHCQAIAFRFDEKDNFVGCEEHLSY